MDKIKKEIRKNCKKAYDYAHIRFPFGNILVVLFDKDETSFFEFEYSVYVPRRDKIWVSTLLNEIDERKKNGKTI